MIFDTDVLIWIQRGNRKAARQVDRETERKLSVLSYMELMQGAHEKRQQQTVKRFLKELGFQVLPLTENIGHRAAIYVEEYALSHGLRASDAIVAATATEHDLTLCSGNARHFKPIKQLRFRHFRP